MGFFGGWHWIIIVAVVLALFGYRDAFERAGRKLAERLRSLIG